MFGLLYSIAGLAEDVAKTATAPVSIVADTARIVTKPVGNLADELAKEVRTIAEDITE